MFDSLDIDFQQQYRSKQNRSDRPLMSSAKSNAASSETLDMSILFIKKYTQLNLKTLASI